MAPSGVVGGPWDRGRPARTDFQRPRRCRQLNAGPSVGRAGGTPAVPGRNWSSRDFRDPLLAGWVGVTTSAALCAFQPNRFRQDRSRLARPAEDSQNLPCDGRELRVNAVSTPGSKRPAVPWPHVEASEPRDLFPAAIAHEDRKNAQPFAIPAVEQPGNLFMPDEFRVEKIDRNQQNGDGCQVNGSTDLGKPITTGGNVTISPYLKNLLSLKNAEMFYQSILQLLVVMREADKNDPLSLSRLGSTTAGHRLPLSRFLNPLIDGMAMMRRISWYLKPSTGPFSTKIQRWELGTTIKRFALGRP